mmetsp:Transcript_38157/g.56797  ORF Transcript_38157/g.56797 Transcript_38157/m.56797 type:complete len:215 (-) Transcript_38157:804-1448(-)
MRQQEFTTLQNLWTIVRIASLYKSFDTKPASVAETTCPRSIPRTVLTLDALQKILALVDGMKNFLTSMIRKHFMKLVQSCQAGHTAFHVRIVNHDISKHFRWIELFVPAKATIVFVRSPTAIFVLKRQHNVDRLFEPIVGKTFQLSSFYRRLNVLIAQQTQSPFEAFSGTITNGPTVRTSTEGPSSFTDMTIVLLAKGRGLVLVGWRRTSRFGR